MRDEGVSPLSSTCDTRARKRSSQEQQAIDPPVVAATQALIGPCDTSTVPQSQLAPFCFALRMGRCKAYHSFSL